MAEVEKDQNLRRVEGRAVVISSTDCQVSNPPNDLPNSTQETSRRRSNGYSQGVTVASFQTRCVTLTTGGSDSLEVGRTSVPLRVRPRRLPPHVEVKYLTAFFILSWCLEQDGVRDEKWSSDTSCSQVLLTTESQSVPRWNSTFVIVTVVDGISCYWNLEAAGGTPVNTMMCRVTDKSP